MKYILLNFILLISFTSCSLIKELTMTEDEAYTIFFENLKNNYTTASGITYFYFSDFEDDLYISQQELMKKLANNNFTLIDYQSYNGAVRFFTFWGKNYHPIKEINLSKTFNFGSTELILNSEMLTEYNPVTGRGVLFSRKGRTVRQRVNEMIVGDLYHKMNAGNIYFREGRIESPRWFSSELRYLNNDNEVRIYEDDVTVYINNSPVFKIEPENYYKGEYSYHAVPYQSSKFRVTPDNINFDVNKFIYTEYENSLHSILKIKGLKKLKPLLLVMIIDSWYKNLTSSRKTPSKLDDISVKYYNYIVDESVPFDKQELETVFKFLVGNSLSSPVGKSYRKYLEFEGYKRFGIKID